MAHRRQRAVGGLLHGPFRSAARAFGWEWQNFLRLDRPDRRRAKGTKHKASPKCGRFTVGLTVVFVVHNPLVVYSLLLPHVPQMSPRGSSAPNYTASCSPFPASPGERLKGCTARIVPSHSAFRKRNPTGRIICRLAIKNDSSGTLGKVKSIPFKERNRKP
jgi:hypothetical protein